MDAATDVIVIGAGVSGLACARELGRRGTRCVVLERARGVGGRCATRRVEGQPVDHGVPFLHARSGEFGEALNALDPAGKVRGWPVRVREPRLACTPDSLAPGRRRMARREGVSAFPKALAREVDVRLLAEVVALEEDGDHVVARLRDGETLAARFVVAAAALPETLHLVAPLVRDWPDAAARLAALRDIAPIPTLTVLAGYGEAAPALPFDLWNPLEATMVQSISHDSAKRAAPRERVLVIHGRPRWSSEWLARGAGIGPGRAAWMTELLWETGELLGPWAATPRWAQPHAWRAARIRRRDVRQEPEVFESRRGGRVALVGDAFGGAPGLEGAYLSGIAMGEQIATLPRARERSA